MKPPLLFAFFGGGPVTYLPLVAFLDRTQVHFFACFLRAFALSSPSIVQPMAFFDN